MRLIFEASVNVCSRNQYFAIKKILNISQHVRKDEEKKLVCFLYRLPSKKSGIFHMFFLSCINYFC